MFLWPSEKFNKSYHTRQVVLPLIYNKPSPYFPPFFIFSLGYIIDVRFIANLPKVQVQLETCLIWESLHVNFVQPSPLIIKIWNSQNAKNVMQKSLRPKVNLIFIVFDIFNGTMLVQAGSPVEFRNSRSIWITRSWSWHSWCNLKTLIWPLAVTLHLVF